MPSQPPSRSVRGARSATSGRPRCASIASARPLSTRRSDMPPGRSARLPGGARPRSYAGGLPSPEGPGLLGDRRHRQHHVGSLGHRRGPLLQRDQRPTASSAASAPAGSGRSSTSTAPTAGPDLPGAHRSKDRVAVPAVERRQRAHAPGASRPRREPASPRRSPARQQVVNAPPRSRRARRPAAGSSRAWRRWPRPGAAPRSARQARRPAARRPGSPRPARAAAWRRSARQRRPGLLGARSERGQELRLGVRAALSRLPLSLRQAAGRERRYGDSRGYRRFIGERIDDQPPKRGCPCKRSQPAITQTLALNAGMSMPAVSTWP